MYVTAILPYIVLAIFLIDRVGRRPLLLARTERRQLQRYREKATSAAAFAAIADSLPAGDNSCFRLEQHRTGPQQPPAILCPHRRRKRAGGKASGGRHRRVVKLDTVCNYHRIVYSCYTPRFAMFKSNYVFLDLGVGSTWLLAAVGSDDLTTVADL